MTKEEKDENVSAAKKLLYTREGERAELRKQAKEAF